MKNIKLALFTGALAAASPAMAADLLDVYRLAQQSDPEIAIAEANFLAAREASPQARAGYLPQLQGSAEYGRSDTESSGEQFFAGQSLPNESTQESDTLQWSIELRQPIFDWAALKEMSRASAAVARAEAEFETAKQQLIIRVAETYFNLLAAQDSLQAAQINKEAIGRQLDQAKKRFEVGLIAITDVQESQAAFDQATAEVIAAERLANSTRENLRAIIGEYIRNPAAPRDDFPLLTPQPASQDAWVTRALEQNLAVVANRFALEAAEHVTDIRRAGHYPSLDLVARHSSSDSDFTSGGLNQQGQFRTSTGTSERSSDYIGVRLSVPIFSGGRTQSMTREAAHQASAARSSLKQAMRSAESQARDNYLGVLSDIARVQALKQAYESSQTALRATQAGYEVGTRTAVDVLAARRNELQALVNYQRARYDYILNTLRLKQAAGTLSPEDVAEVAQWMEEGKLQRNINETTRSSS